jgi:D-glycero-D-manno-heptose 1,7-bisphosphate phosphatase
MGKAAVFLDRDDTLIENVPYLGDPEKVKLLSGAKEAIQKLHQQKLPLIIVSNQSGVGRGLITKEQVRAVDARMEHLLGIPSPFLSYRHCFAAPGDPYDERRKPSPLMLQEAAADHGLDLTRSIMVGNRLSDIQAGHTAGCQTLLLKLRVHTDDEKEATALATYAAESWLEAVDWILSRPQIKI